MGLCGQKNNCTRYSLDPRFFVVNITEEFVHAMGLVELDAASAGQFHDAERKEEKILLTNHQTGLEKIQNLRYCIIIKVSRNIATLTTTQISLLINISI